MNKFDLEFEEFISRQSANFIHLPCKFDYKLSEDFIKKYKDRLYWEEISMYQQLSEDFIRKFSDKVDWTNVSFYQKLSEEFIREFSDKVDWNYIPLCYFKFEYKRSWKTFL